MITLSDRLKLIADNINRGETMADIGTDHGFLPIFLLENDISPFVVMADLSEPSLNKAKENFTSSTPVGVSESQYDFRLGSGISVLQAGEVDNVVIAGMGGRLMIEILQEDFAKTVTFNKFILQPRNGLGHLRHWMAYSGFVIDKELLVKEEDKICTIIVARPEKYRDKNGNPTGNPSIRKADSAWFRKYEPTANEEFPQRVLRENPYLGEIYFKERIQHFESIIKEIEAESGSENPRIQILKDSIDYLNEMLHNI